MRERGPLRWTAAGKHGAPEASGLFAQFSDNMTPDHLPSQALDMRNVDEMACMSQAGRVWA